MFEWLTVLSLQFVMSGSVKNNFYMTFAWQRNGWWWKSWIKSDCRIIWYLFAGLKPIILYSVHSILFVKYLFSSEIWFVKTSTRIVKYESRVVKSSPHPKAMTITKNKACIVSLMKIAIWWGRNNIFNSVLI